ncbi:acetyltransferase [Pseudovibrio japonicus]|uniref:Acetyltransferase n=1 Tax=Pseudovibrio japonicus TaxID=366534 RepID=A0ABQ3E0P5_9HYPH|nr:GNAT family N-acetyltransferase [Pseudovibrio japonicus]GHB22563.1 acetyltransferase [Pseudovibrio japonicus]
MDNLDLELEPLNSDHAQSMFQGLSDPALYTYTDDSPPESVDALRETYRRRECGISPDGRQHWLNWIIKSQISGQCLGYVQATIDHEDDRTEIAYVVFRKYWNQNIAKRAVAMMLELLRQDWRLRRVVAVIDSRNHPSVRVARALGFAPISRKSPQASKYDVIYELLPCQHELKHLERSSDVG